jgi:hypothetical protein
MEKTDYYKETAEGKLIYDYSGFHHVPSSMAIAVRNDVRDNLEEDTEGTRPVEETIAVETPETTKEKSPLTNVKNEAIKDNEQDYLHCKIG